MTKMISHAHDQDKHKLGVDSMMKSYQSPYNHKVSVIPPDPKCADEEQERERIQLALNRELLELSEQLPFIDARIDELKIVIEALTERLNTLQSEKEEKEARKLQLKKMKETKP